MKKLIFAALAIAAMAACTKSNVEFEQPGEIAFQPVAQKATKAAVVGTTYPTDAAYNFNVWAWWGDKEAGTLDSQIAAFNTVYINNQTFKHKEDNNWGGITPYYWPTTGSLYFAGYSPASVQGNNGCVVSYDKNNKKFSATGYQQTTDISKTVDLMWFHLTDESYDRTTASVPVPVQFHHALSWLSFRFNLENPTTPQLWKVNSVTLRSVETKANFTATKTDAAEKLGTAYWTNHSETANITVFKANDEGEKYLVQHVTDPYTVGLNDGSILESTPNGVLVIPQRCDMTRAQLVIEFEQKAPSDEWVPQTKFLSLGEDWLPSKHYVYTITFGAEEILIAPTVVDWAPVYDLAVPVE